MAARPPEYLERNIIFSIENNTSKPEIDLQGFDVNNIQIIQLANALGKNTSLHSLNLEGNNIGDAGTIELVKALKTNKSLESLNLRKNKIGALGAKALSEALRTNTALKFLNLDHNKIGAEGAQALCEGLRTNTTLENLRLYDNNIGDEGAIEFAKVLEYNKGLKVLILEKNKIADKGIKALYLSVGRSNTLKAINLYGNKFSKNIIVDYIDFFYKNNSIISLGFDNIGKLGVRYICRLLEKNTTLESLSLNLSAVGNKEMEFIANALKINKTLTTLHLTSTSIDDKGASILAEALKINTGLVEIYIFDSKIGDIGAEAIAESLKQNKTLYVFRIYGKNKVKNKGFDALVSVPFKSKTLFEVRIESELNNKCSHTFHDNLSKRRKQIIDKLLKEFNEIIQELEQLMTAFEVLDCTQTILCKSYLNRYNTLRLKGNRYSLYLLLSFFDDAIKEQINISDKRYKLLIKNFESSLNYLNIVQKYSPSSMESSPIESKQNNDKIINQEESIHSSSNATTPVFSPKSLVSPMASSKASFNPPSASLPEAQSQEVVLQRPTLQEQHQKGGNKHRPPSGMRVRRSPIMPKRQLQLPSQASNNSTNKDGNTTIPPIVGHEIKITQEQLQFISTLQSSGIQPETIQQLQRQLDEFSISKEELQYYKAWIESFSSKIKQLETDISETNLTFARDPHTEKEQAYIDAEPKLKNYQRRLQKELSTFITCYFLAPAGIFKLEDNKKDTAISAISGIPVAGQFLKILTSGLSFANKKYRIYQMNRLNELFNTVDHITQVCCAFARQLTLAQEDTIQLYNFQKYKGIAKVKGFVLKVKEMLDHPGISYVPEDKLAVLDASYLLEHILSGDAKIDKNKDLALQFVEVVLGTAHKPRVFDEHQVSNTSRFMSSKPALNLTFKTQEVRIAPSQLTVQSRDSTMKLKTPAISMEDVQQLLREQSKAQDEALRKQQEEFERYKREKEEEHIRILEETEKARTKAEEAIAEQRAHEEEIRKQRETLQRQQEFMRQQQGDIEKLKKNLLPKSDAGGGPMAQELLNPANDDGGSMMHHTETAQILSKHSEQLRELLERFPMMEESQRQQAQKIDDLQDKADPRRAKEGNKCLEQVQYLKKLEDKKGQEEARIREQQKIKQRQQLQSGLM